MRQAIRKQDPNLLMMMGLFDESQVGEGGEKQIHLVIDLGVL